jgi:hypothetical protein
VRPGLEVSPSFPAHSFLFREACLKWLSLLILTFSIILSLSSFYTPEGSAFIPPKPAIEQRLEPLPYNVSIEYLSWVIRASDLTGVPVWILARMFSVECSVSGDALDSRWQPRAVSWAGAQGIAQLMPVNLPLFAVLFNDGKTVDPFDPETAIRVGAKYLAALHELTGSWRLAIMSYDGGSGHWSNPKRYGEWRQESIDYVKAVLN